MLQVMEILKVLSLPELHQVLDGVDVRFGQPKALSPVQPSDEPVWCCRRLTSAAPWEIAKTQVTNALIYALAL